MSETIRVEGLAELEHALRSFAPMVKGNPLRNAARAMTVPIIDRAKSLAHVSENDGGTLRDSITAKLIPVGERDAATEKGDSVEVFQVGPRSRGKGGAPYAHMVEFGIPSGQGAQPARPFLRPALEETKDEMITAFTNKLGADLERIRKRLVKQGRI